MFIQLAQNLSENTNKVIVDAVDTVKDKVYSWFEAAVAMLPNVAVAILVLILFVIIAKLARKAIRRFGGRINHNQAVVSLTEAVVYILIIGIGFFVALSVLNLDKTVTSLLAGAGIVGIAIGFAFQDSAANFLSGIMIAFRKPYQINDIIEAQGYMGTVARINLRSTVIQTFQGQEVLVPNRQIFNDPITNYSNTGRRRIDLNVGISYGDSLQKVRQVTLNALKDADFVEKGSEVMVDFYEFGNSSINFTVRFWIKYPDQPGFLEARSKAVMRIKKAFDENDITIPFPIRTLDFGIKGGKTISEMVVPTRREENGTEDREA